MQRAQELMQGALDLHIHSGPGLIKRSVTHLEACRLAYDAGMRAVLLKDHHCGTHNLVQTLKECLAFERPFDIFSGLAVNNTAGGLSPAVVEAAIGYGVKAVWMPTLSAAFNRNYHAGLDAKAASSMPKSAGKITFDTPMALLDDFGKLKQEVVDIVRLVAEADIILGNGHISQRETDLLIDCAKGMGVKKIVINHPELQLRMPLEKMVEYTRAGVYLEHILAIIYSDKSSHEYIYEMLQATGTEFVIVSSDLGQVGRPVPTEGILRFIEAMLNLGLPESDITAVLRDNPTKLTGLA